MKNHAKYLVKDFEVKLFHGDDVEDALKDGWAYPATPMSNGAPWNPEVEDDEVSAADAAAEVQKANGERQAKKDAEKAKEQADLQKDSEAAQEKDAKSKVVKSKE